MSEVENEAQGVNEETNKVDGNGCEDHGSLSRSSRGSSRDFRGFYRGARGGSLHRGRGRGGGERGGRGSHRGGPFGASGVEKRNPRNDSEEPSVEETGNGSRGGERGRGGRSGGRGFDRVAERLQALQGSSTLDLPPLELQEKKFSGRSRLYIGNLSPDCSEEQLKEIVSQFGEIGEMFFNKEKHFGFLRLSSRADAEKAKSELDGKLLHGRALKVRFAPHQAAIKVSNLGPWVSNELLFRAFSIFGDIERCSVFVDERGRGKGEGFVEFDRKPSAFEALKRCKEGCFFLTTSLRPVVVEPIEETEDDGGLQEKLLPKRSQELLYEREKGPRFAEPGSFEFEYGSKWKALAELKKQKLSSLEREMKLEEDKLLAQMEYAKYEHETEQLRHQLRHREANREAQKTNWEERDRQMSEMMRLEVERRSQDEVSMMNRMQETDNSLRVRQQENSLFVQAQELNNLLDQQEEDVNGSSPWAGSGRPPGNFIGGGGGGGGGAPFGNFGHPPHYEGGFAGNRRPGGWNNDGPGAFKRRRF